MKKRIDEIIISDRVRSDFGDVESLARSMMNLGQLQPIGIDSCNTLVFGERRIRAAKSLGWEEVDAVEINCDLLGAERDENEMRKQFTVTERLAIAQRISDRMQGRAGGDRKTDQGGNISTLICEAGKTRDIAAKRAGLGSGKTLEAAQKVVEHGSPELVSAMDAGKVSIHAAAKISSLPHEDQSTVDYSDRGQVKRAKVKADPVTKIHLVIEYSSVDSGAKELARSLISRDCKFAEALFSALGVAISEAA